MKLQEIDFWYARVSGKFLITEEIEEGFPLNIGALTITSSDKQRNFVIDTYFTDFVNPQKKGEFFEFESKLEIDEETFPRGEETNYNLEFEDLLECDAVLYLSKCDMDKGDFDFENNFELKVTFYFEKGKSFSIDVKIEE